MSSNAIPPSTLYDPAFYAAQADGSFRSAMTLLRHVIELLQPRSIIDAGCGAGTWLAAAQRLGVEDVFGVDGGAPGEHLRIPRERWLSARLDEPFSDAPAIREHGRYDLAMSMEVAEHLPSGAAAAFVHELVGLSDVVLFSAAVPHQGGKNHVNEQWPSYWASLFDAHAYVPVDATRRAVWNQPGITPYYRHHLLYASPAAIQRDERLRRLAESTDRGFLDVIHPEFYARRADLQRKSPRQLVRALWSRVAPWR